VPIGTINQEWLSHNANRRYPLADDAEGVDTSGSFRLPSSFLVELDLPVHAGLNTGPAGFFVQSVAAYAGGYGVVIAYQPDGDDPITVASALIPRQGFVRNSTFTLGGVGTFEDTVGKLVIGRLDDIDDQPPGFWQFTLETGRLDPDAVRPIIRGVSSIVCVNGSQRSAPLYGDIELVAGSNFQLVPIVQDGQDPVIRLNAISGEGTVQDCVCEGDSAQTSPITRLNGVTPTNSGDFAFVGSDCVEVEAIDNGIRVRNSCAQPCCGPAELERITTDLERFGSQAASVEEFVGRLRTSVDTMDLVVLGAKLSDRSCISCE
jgi:hypothetical protein